MTAIIVDSSGEAFVGWFKHCDVSASGFETYRSEPHFAKAEWMAAGSHPLFYGYPPTGRVVNSPKVFASKHSAERAMRRIARRHWRDMAVVT